MRNEIEKAIRETLVIVNQESIHRALDKIMKIIDEPKASPCKMGLHPTDFFGKCFECGKQIFTKE